jgi:periplasmic divalent cation tolerance protein
MTDFIQVATTTSSRDEAEHIARRLVESHLAACAHISQPITSIYRWQGNLEHSQEWVCTLKTRASRFAEVAQAIRTNHSYQCPEIVATPIVDASADYLAWLEKETDAG